MGVTGGQETRLEETGESGESGETLETLETLETWGPEENNAWLPSFFLYKKKLDTM